MKFLECNFGGHTAAVNDDGCLVSGHKLFLPGPNNFGLWVPFCVGSHRCVWIIPVWSEGHHGRGCRHLNWGDYQNERLCLEQGLKKNRRP